MSAGFPNKKMDNLCQKSAERRRSQESGVRRKKKGEEKEGFANEF
jgi:hypothetical protein